MCSMDANSDQRSQELEGVIRDMRRGLIDAYSLMSAVIMRCMTAGTGVDEGPMVSYTEATPEYRRR